MKILVACEESQRVCIEFRKLGHWAFSCDIQECTGGHPEWHIKDDVIPLLNGWKTFYTCDGDIHTILSRWDMIIAFPPCTNLCVSGARWFEEKRRNGSQREAIEFFGAFLKAQCEKLCIENPIGIISGDYIEKWFPTLAERYCLPLKPTQIIEPWMFGHEEKKATCLWLRNLPPLVPTKIMERRFQRIWRMPPGADRSRERSKTYTGIAKAMAEQWG